MKKKKRKKKKKPISITLYEGHIFESQESVYMHNTSLQFFENNQIITVIIILGQKMTMNKDLTLLA